MLSNRSDSLLEFARLIDDELNFLDARWLIDDFRKAAEGVRPVVHLLSVRLDLQAV